MNLGKGAAPAELLERVFAHIAATRMAGLPICNAALHVQVVGCREWSGRYVAVLLTPWTINLVLLPGAASLDPLPLDVKRTWAFPSGSYEFMGLNEAALGGCHICPLVSPTLHIATQEEALSIAEEIMRQLFLDEQSGGEARNEMMEAARFNGEKLMDKPLSRRDFLRGAFGGS